MLTNNPFNLLSEHRKTINVNKFEILYSHC